MSSKQWATSVKLVGGVAAVSTDTKSRNSTLLHNTQHTQQPECIACCLPFYADVMPDRHGSLLQLLLLPNRPTLLLPACRK